jgi:RecB family endonuclease NucS
MLYRVNHKTVEQVEATTAINEDLYEQQVEDWVAAAPEMLGEPLLIIGRQVGLDSGRDFIDLLALDSDGSLVVIELKRDLIGGDADLQALRYAALIGGSQYDPADNSRRP